MTGGRRGVHVLTVTTADGVPVRLAAERAVRALGWVLAWSPADADLLVVCGSPQDAELEVLDRVWRQLPGPRARVQLDGTENILDALAAAAATLEDRVAQERLAHEADMDAQTSGRGGEDMDHEHIDSGGMDHEGMDHGDAGLRWHGA